MKNEKDLICHSKQTYTLPNLIQSMFHKKVQSSFSSIFKKTVPRIFVFNLTQGTLGYKSSEIAPIKRSYIKSQLTGFVANVDINDELVKKFKYGFKIFTYDRNYILYTDDRDDYDNWIRMLNYHFYKNDIFIGRRLKIDENAEKKVTVNVEEKDDEKNGKKKIFMINQKFEEYDKKFKKKLKNKIEEKIDENKYINEKTYVDKKLNEAMSEAKSEPVLNIYEKENKQSPEKKEVKFQVENLHFKNIITKAIEKNNNKENDKNHSLILDESRLLNSEKISKFNNLEESKRILLIKYVRDENYENKNFNNKLSNITRNILKNTNYEYGFGEFYQVQNMLYQNNNKNLSNETDKKYFEDKEEKNIISEKIEKIKDLNTTQNESYKDYENIMIKPIDLLNRNKIESDNSEVIASDSLQIKVDSKVNNLSSPLNLVKISIKSK